MAEAQSAPTEKTINIGESINVKIIAIDKKIRNLTLSLEAKIKQEEKILIDKINKNYKQNTTTLGDLIKQKLNNIKKEKKNLHNE